MSADQLDHSDGWVVQTWSGAALTSSKSAVTDSDPEIAPDRAASFIISTVEKILAATRPAEATRSIANRLQQYFGCRQVAIVACSDRSVLSRTLAMSGVVRHDSHSSLVRSICAAMEETRRANRTIVVPAKGDELGSSHAHRQLLPLLGADNVVSVPLAGSRGVTVAVAVFVDAAPEAITDFLATFGAVLAGCLGATRRPARPGWLAALGRKQPARKATLGRRVLFTAVVAASLLCLPTPYRLKCYCTVEPVTRRYVASPFDGTLAKSYKQPGDVVAANDLLARLDQRELRWERSSLETELAHARKEKDSALASHRTSDAQLAVLAMERLQVQIELLAHRQQHLEIRSPIDGIVVAGDLERAEGAPLVVGQTMFEIAPLRRMLVEIEVPEEEIAYIAERASTRVVLDAAGLPAIEGRVQRLHPQAELRERSSVFIAEMECDNSSGTLRPGMRGTARLSCGTRTLGWILFHRPWARIRQMTGW